jgi:hypothetical protein
VTPFERAFGSLEGFASQARADMDAGTLDPRDGSDVLEAVRGWHDDRLWGELSPKATNRTYRDSAP